VNDSIYRDHADVYSTFSEKSLPNTVYDRPAMMRLAGDLDGRHVLELGCAAGGLTAQLIEAGADVVGLDREPRLIDLARRRLGSVADFRVADLDEPLSMFETASMDCVVASLVLHYLEDWAPLLGELHRVLRPGGALVFSIHHPITGWALSDQADYHRVELIQETWDWDGVPVTARMYRRPLSAIFGSLRDAGFAVEIVDEPLPDSRAAGDERVLEVLTTKPVFLFVRAVRG
jgi:SAM-dependent methyltransferase